jgi:hypothetical protein
MPAEKNAVFLPIQRALNRQRVDVLYSVISGDQKVSVHLMITIQKVTSNVRSAPASLQTFIDTLNCVLEDHVQYSMVHIPNVFYDGHLQIISHVGILLIAPQRKTQVYRDFLITLYICIVPETVLL